jgi:hypothetical protein
MTTSTVSLQTRKNWWIDAALFSVASIAVVSGIYFLIIPSGGYQGGRNPAYNVRFLFTRSTWDDLHTWGGVAMIVIALIHLVLHWRWVKSMAVRSFNELFHGTKKMNRNGRINLLINLLIGMSFLATSLSGIYFLAFPGGHNVVSPAILLSRSTWDLVHTWSGVILILAAILHFAIHWKWVSKVSGRVLLAGVRDRRILPTPVSNS